MSIDLDRQLRNTSDVLIEIEVRVVNNVQAHMVGNAIKCYFYWLSGF